MVLVLMMAVTGRAQGNNSLFVTFDHLALSVKDIDRSAGFYKKVLGLQEITNRTEVEGIRWFSLGQDQELHLIVEVNSVGQDS